MAGPIQAIGQRPTVTAIIVTHNSAHVVGSLISDLRRESGDVALEVIVVDSGSSDPSYLEDYRLDIRICHLENVGFGHAANLGASASTTDWLAFLNPDVRLPEAGTLRHLVEDAEAYEVSLISSILTDANGCYASYGDLARPPWVRRSKRRGPFGPQIEAAETVSGAFMLVRREVFEKLGGFDVRFFLYSEEMDLHKRLMEAGDRIAVCQHIHVFHAREQGSEGVQPVWRYTQRLVGRTVYMRKHFGIPAGLVSFVDAFVRLSIRAPRGGRVATIAKFVEALRASKRRLNGEELQAP